MVITDAHTYRHTYRHTHEHTHEHTDAHTHRPNAKNVIFGFRVPQTYKKFQVQLYIIQM